MRRFQTNFSHPLKGNLIILKKMAFCDFWKACLSIIFRGHSQTTWTRLGGWVVGQMSTIVHVMQVGGSSNVHVDKMQERLQTKLLRIMSKKSFFCEKTYCQDQVQTPKSLNIGNLHVFSSLIINHKMYILKKQIHNHNFHQ